MTRKKIQIHRGMLVTIEGIAGVGKTYFANKLEKLFLKEFKISPLRMGGFIDRDVENIPEITKFLRSMMKTSRFIGLPWLCETTMLLAEQAYNLDSKVLPALKRGELILYENYNDALIAYQLMRGNSIKISQKTLKKILQDFIDLQYVVFLYPKPDIIIYLSSPLNIIFDRLKTRENRNVLKKDKIDIELIVNNYEKLYKEVHSIIRICNDENTDLSKECKKIAERIINIYKKNK